jgi:hypothetical protein
MGIEELLKSRGRVGPSFLQKDEANTMACEETALSLETYISSSDEATSLPIFSQRTLSYCEA